MLTFSVLRGTAVRLPRISDVRVLDFLESCDAYRPSERIRFIQATFPLTRVNLKTNENLSNLSLRFHLNTGN